MMWALRFFIFLSYYRQVSWETELAHVGLKDVMKDEQREGGGMSETEKDKSKRKKEGNETRNKMMKKK